jgi:RNA polymerase sigma factor (TIGR02999 family)
VTPHPDDLTRLLSEASSGDADALDQLFPLVYGELRQLAAAQLRRERPDHTLGATALVHEAYLRLLGGVDRFDNRAHFFGIAARAMRRILVEHARRRSARKRSSQFQVTLDTAIEQAAAAPSDEVLAVDESLSRLAARDARAAQVVECRYFAGFSIEETADALGISPATVKREWTMARAWLFRDLAGSAGAAE